MGQVSAVLVARVLRQVDDHGIVVWFDPGRQYERTLGDVTRSGVSVEVFDGSVFDLRKRIEPCLASWERPRLVVYVPAHDQELSTALAEVIAAGVVLKPGQQPVQRNTRMGVVARAALAGRMAPEVLESVVKQAEAGALTLDDLDQLAEQGVGPASGTLGLVFGTSAPNDIALAFLSDATADNAIEQKQARADLETLLSVNYGFTAKGEATLEELRRSFARFVLTAEFLHALGELAPETFTALPKPRQEHQRDACIELVTIWRQRRDRQQAYVHQADAVETQLGVDDLSLPLVALQRACTFLSLEERLQSAVEAALLDAHEGELFEIIERRRQGFWAAVDPEVLDRWALDAAAARLLATADRVEAELQRLNEDALALARAYQTGVEGRDPWCLLDTFHRQMERRFHHFELDITGGHESLECLVVRARQRFTEVSALLAERFTAALERCGFHIPEYRVQAQVFRRFVEPPLAQGKTAYMLVDALRFEMARELQASLDGPAKGTLSAVVATLPTITEVGMAALLPGADRSIELAASSGSGGLSVVIDGTRTRNRKDRLQHLVARVGVPTHVAHLEEILPPAKKVREAIQNARLVVLTASDELDGLCEQGNVAMARRLMDDVLLQVRRAMRVLFDLGIESCVVTSDHGFLFGEALDTGSLIDSPGGTTADLRRRVWVGKGGASHPGTVRVKAGATGLVSDLEFVLPRGLGGFKVPGGQTAYFHGGASLAELLVPVLVVTEAGGRAKPQVAAIQWTLTTGSRVVSTRFLSVQLAGRASALFVEAPPKVRLEARAGRDVVSRPVASLYGFDEETGLIAMAWQDDNRRELRPNTVTLMLDLPVGTRELSIVLLDGETERILATITVPVSMAGF
jgi:hypothetical protein